MAQEVEIWRMPFLFQTQYYGNYVANRITGHVEKICHVGLTKDLSKAHLAKIDTIIWLRAHHMGTF